MNSSREARALFKHLEAGSIGWNFARRAMKLPPQTIREVLRLLAARKKQNAQFIFLREATEESDERLVETWARALRWLLDMRREASWGSKQVRGLVRALANDPRALGAVQAAVVSNPRAPPAHMLAALAADGSDASVDALMPVFAGPERYWMRQLATHAADTPAMKAMLEAIDARTEKEETARRKTSVGLKFARDSLGLDVEKFDVRVHLGSVEENANDVQIIQGDVTLGTEFSVYLGFLSDSGDDDKSTFFSTRTRRARDELKLGRCTLEELPQWLLGAQRKLGITWATEFPVRGPTGIAQFRDWLFGPTRAANAKKVIVSRGRARSPR